MTTYLQYLQYYTDVIKTGFCEMKNNLTFVVIYFYSYLYVQKDRDTYIFPIYLDNKILYIPLTKKNNEEIYKYNDKLSKMEKKSLIALLHYKLMYNSDKYISLISRVSILEDDIKIRDVKLSDI